MQQKVHAIVLRSRKFRESSSLLTLFCRELGKVTVVAHGRGKKGGQASIHQVFCSAEVLLNLKEQRDLQVLARVESTSLPLHLFENFSSMQHMFAICETIDRVTESSSPHEQVYDMLDACLQSLNVPTSHKNAIDPAILRIRFLLKYAEFNGFGFQLVAADNTSTSFSLDLSTGAIATSRSERNSCFPLSSTSFQFLFDVFSGKLPKHSPDQHVMRELLSMLSAYYEVHTGQIISPRAHAFDSDLGNW